MFYKPFRYVVNCVNAGVVVDKNGTGICQVCQEEEEELTEEDYTKLHLIVVALNQVISDEFVE